MDVDELVHDAALDADELVLGPPRQPGQLDGVDPEPEEDVEGERQAPLDRRRGGHPGPDGDIPAEDALEPPDRVPSPRQLVDDPRQVVRPAQGRARQVLDIEPDLLAEIEGDDATARVDARGDGEDHGPVRGGREDEALVVVGVLSDQVDPARRADEEGSGPEPGLEGVGDLSGSPSQNVTGS